MNLNNPDVYSMGAAKAALTTLRKARATLNAPGKWTKGAVARGKNGLELNDDEVARHGTCFCSLGAVVRHAEPYSDEYGHATGYLASAMGTRNQQANIPSVNDAKATTHENVLDFFSLAIELAKDDVKAMKRAYL